jgi:hypothetical protein
MYAYEMPAHACKKYIAIVTPHQINFLIAGSTRWNRTAQLYRVEFETLPKGQALQKLAARWVLK